MRQGGYTFKGLLTLIVVFMTGSPAVGEQWPPVKPVTQSFEVNLAVGLVAIDLPIRSKDDSVLYRLSCRGGSEKILDELGEHDDVNWVAESRKLCGVRGERAFAILRTGCGGAADAALAGDGAIQVLRGRMKPFSFTAHRTKITPSVPAI
jgi:hypothetical protein